MRITGVEIVPVKLPLLEPFVVSDQEKRDEARRLLGTIDDLIVLAHLRPPDRPEPRPGARVRR